MTNPTSLLDRAEAPEHCHTGRLDGSGEWYDRCPVSGCKWGGDKVRDVPPSYDQPQVEKAKRPKARIFWIETPSESPFRYWETNISHDPDPKDRASWLKVREVTDG